MDLMKLADQPAGGGLRVIRHLVVLTVVVVEGHDVDHLDPGVMAHRAAKHPETTHAQAICRGGKQVDELDCPMVSGRPPLDEMNRLVPSVDGGVPTERVVLDVEIESGDVVRRDDLLVRPRDCPSARTTVCDVRPAMVRGVPAERRDDVTPAARIREMAGPKVSQATGMFGSPSHVSLHDPFLGVCKNARVRYSAPDRRDNAARWWTAYVSKYGANTCAGRTPPGRYHEEAPAGAAAEAVSRQIATSAHSMRGRSIESG